TRPPSPRYAGRRRRSWWTGEGEKVVDEAEWLACQDPRPMWHFLHDKASERKLRLFAVACCRGVWERITPGRVRQAVEVGERYADGLASEADLRRAHSMACQSAHNFQMAHSRGRWGHFAREAESRLFFAADAAHPNVPFLVRRLGWV